MWRKPQCFLILRRESERRAWASIPFCWFLPRQTSPSHNLHLHPDTNHRLNPKLPCAKYDNPASPPTSTAISLPQNKTKTDNYHLCYVQNTIINGGSANYIACLDAFTEECSWMYIHMCSLHYWGRSYFSLQISLKTCVLKDIQEEIWLKTPISHFINHTSSLLLQFV